MGANVFRWTISNSPCVSSSSNIDDVTITRSDTPSNAAAGSDQTVCATTATLVGNTPSVGTGLWTLVSGTGTISSASAANSGVTGLGVGANVFRWTISNSPCVSSSSNIDNITITRTNTASNANAGADQTVCATIGTLAGNTPSPGTGAWTKISGFGTITSPSSPTSGITGLGVGVNVFRWTISNAPCAATSDDVSITRSSYPTTANAGTNQAVCAATATLAGNTATEGTGLWTLIQGAGTITTPSSPTSGITGLGVGTNKFRWTISKTNCIATFSDVIITRFASGDIISTNLNVIYEAGETFVLDGTSYFCQTRDENTVADGNCGTYITYTAPIYIPYNNNTPFYSDGSYNYYHDGNCGYTQCPLAGAFISSSIVSYGNKVYIDGIPYFCQTAEETLTTDGHCGQTASYSMISEPPNPPQYIAHDNQYNYYWDSNCNYYTETYCPPAGTTITSSATYSTVYIYELGSSFTCQNIYYTETTDGNCGSYSSSYTDDPPSYGTQITSDNQYNYLWNGSCGYYTENNCPPYGDPISSSSSVNSVYISELNSYFTCQTTYYTVTADGNCGSNSSSYTDDPPSYGTQITSDNQYNYLWNGSCGYYTENICPPAGQTTSTSIYSSVYITELGISFTCQTTTYTETTDGNCGSNSSSYTDDPPSNGTQITNDNQYNYFWDGSCGYYKVSICPSPGTVLSTIYAANYDYSTGGSPQMVYINSNYYVCQKVDINTVADGNCSTYTTFTNVTFIPADTFIIQIPPYNYYSNGNCGYYMVACPMSGDVISTISGAVWEIGNGGGSVQINGINYPCQTVNVNTVANGNCGTYITYTDMHPIPSGTIIDNGGGTIYYHDGNCGFY